MNRIVAFLVLSVIMISLAFPVIACHNDADCGGGSKCFCTTSASEGICASSGAVVICPPTHATSIEAIISSITNWVFWLAIIIAPAMIALGGIMMMTSGGDPSRTGTGKSIISWALIGLAIVMFSRGIIALITYIIG